MRQHATVHQRTATRPARLAMRPVRARRRFSACACEACSAPPPTRPPLSWARRTAFVAAGLVTGQLLVIGIDAAIGGPGPFAWVSLLFGKALS